MKNTPLALGIVLALFAGLSRVHPAAVQIGIRPAGKNAILSWPATATNFVLQSTTNLAPASWVAVSNVVPVLVSNNFTITVTNNARARFFRICNTNNTPTVPVPWGMVLIPAGSFTMGDALNDGFADELPLHAVYVSAFYMDQYDVTLALWQQVYTWAGNHGYSFQIYGEGKATNHPVVIDWYSCVKWCNARSEMEGRIPAYYTDDNQTNVYRTGEVDVDNGSVNWNAGYRLPTEAEWEKAAQGGASGQRFPWGDTISWGQANYEGWPASLGGYAYDFAADRGYDPTFEVGDNIFTSPVDYFAPNGYGLYDMAGNVEQWCWDWYGNYSADSQTDPRGPTTGSARVLRGGDWGNYAADCRTANRWGSVNPSEYTVNLGFRSVLYPSQ